jgi:hypothetical protein
VSPPSDKPASKALSNGATRRHATSPDSDALPQRRDDYIPSDERRDVDRDRERARRDSYEPTHYDRERSPDRRQGYDRAAYNRGDDRGTYRDNAFPRADRRRPDGRHDGGAPYSMPQRFDARLSEPPRPQLPAFLRTMQASAAATTSSMGGWGSYGTTDRPGHSLAPHNSQDAAKPPRWDNTSAASKTIHVANVPTDQCTVAVLSTYFGTFGVVTNVTVRPEARDAFIQFSEAAEAQAALTSAAPPLENPSIRVEWASRDSDNDSKRKAPRSAPTAHPLHSHASPQDHRHASSRAVPAAPATPVETPVEKAQRLLKEQQEQAEKVEQMISTQKALVAKLASLKVSIPKEKFMEMMQKVKKQAEVIKAQQDKLNSTVTVAQRAISAAQAAVASAVSKGAAQESLAADQQLIARMGDQISRYAIGTSPAAGSAAKEFDYNVVG